MKLFLMSLSMCLSLSIIGIVAFFYISPSSASNLLPSNQTKPQPQEINSDTTASMIAEIPAKKLGEQTVEYEELTANLKDAFIMITLNAVTDDKKSAEEAKEREFQVRNYLIKELSEVTSEQMADSAYVDSFIKKLESYMNKQMEEGVILKLYVTNKLVQ